MTDHPVTVGPSPLAALKPIAGRALEAALNRALALDPDTRDGLRTLDGRRVALRVASPPLALQVRVAGERLEVGPDRRRGRAGPVGPQHPRRPARRSCRSCATTTHRRWASCASTATPNWRADCSAWPSVSIRTGSSRSYASSARCSACRSPTRSRAGLRHARGAAGAFAGNAAEYVTEESRDVIPREELNAFHDDVDTLRDDVERLAARVGRLRVRAGGGA